MEECLEGEKESAEEYERAMRKYNFSDDILRVLNGQLDELQKHLNTRKFKIKDYEELVFGDESDLLMFNGDIDKISS